MTVHVWKVNSAYCKVFVNAAYLEDLPSEIYSFGLKDYREVHNE